jgi:hypothetical protein
MSPEDVQAIADAVAERLAEGFFKLPPDVANHLKPYAGCRTSFPIDGSMFSIKAQIIIQDDGGFTFGLLDCTGCPLTVERRYHP